MNEPDVYDLNVKPTPRHGWWLMVLFAWDALFARSAYERARYDVICQDERIPDKREDQL